MKYYVVADVHGFFTPLKEALAQNGFFNDKEQHKLIICGDLFDRGKEVLEVQQFALDLLNKDKLILIRGNHEDLMLDMLANFESYSPKIALGVSHHVNNGTFESALRLSKMSRVDALQNTSEFIDKCYSSPFIKTLIPSSIDFFETKDYIFVHGWIPCVTDGKKPYYRRGRHYSYMPNWRDASKAQWEDARWFNGMELAESHQIVERGKTIVCGHWHASYGHCYYENKGNEFGEDADFSPYIGKKVIAIDGCTSHTGMVNCLVIDT